MKWLFIVIICLGFMPRFAVAQNENLDIVSEPICFSIINEASYNILGSLATDYFTRPDGIRARHRSNFRLKKAGTKDKETGEDLDRETFCSYGPFLPNRQLTFTLRTIFPVFECKTRVDHGAIVVKGVRRDDDSGVLTWAECFRADGTKMEKPDQ